MNSGSLSGSMSLEEEFWRPSDEVGARVGPVRVLPGSDPDWLPSSKSAYRVVLISSDNRVHICDRKRALVHICQVQRTYQLTFGSHNKINSNREGDEVLSELRDEAAKACVDAPSGVGVDDNKHIAGKGVCIACTEESNTLGEPAAVTYAEVAAHAQPIRTEHVEGLTVLYYSGGNSSSDPCPFNDIRQKLGGAIRDRQELGGAEREPVQPCRFVDFREQADKVNRSGEQATYGRGEWSRQWKNRGFRKGATSIRPLRWQ